jgi:hypothetical protein
VEKLKKHFAEDMYNIYKRAYKECGYNATRFLTMLYEDKDAIKTASI